MPKAEESAKLLIFFPLDVAFGRVYAITTTFILELKSFARFSLIMGQLLFIIIGSQYQNLHFSNKKNTKTQSSLMA